MLDLNTWPSLDGLTEIPFNDVLPGSLVVVVYDNTGEKGTVPYKSIIMFHKGHQSKTMEWYADPADGGTCYIAAEDVTTTAQLPTTQPLAQQHTLPELGYGHVRGTGEEVCVTRYRDGYLEHTDGATRVHALGDITGFKPIPAYAGDNKRAAALR